jgi:hypothetical protein
MKVNPLLQPEQISQAEQTVATTDFRLAQIFSQTGQAEELVDSKGRKYKYLRGTVTYSDQDTTEASSILLRLKKYELVDDDSPISIVGEITYRDSRSDAYDSFQLLHSKDSGEYELFRRIPKERQGRRFLPRRMGKLALRPVAQHDVVLVNHYLDNFTPYEEE